MTSVQVVFDVSSNAEAPTAELQSALAGITSAVSDLQSQLDGLANAQGLDQIAAQASNAAASLQGAGSSGTEAASGLEDTTSAAGDTGDALQAAGSAGQEAGSGMEAIGVGADVATAGLGAAGGAAGAFGVQAGPAVQIGQELIGTFAGLDGGALAMAGGIAVGTLAIVGMSAAIVGGILNDTAEWGDQMSDLSDLTGISADALAGLQIRLEESGESIQTFTRSIAALSRGMETLSTAAVNDAHAAEEAHKKLAEQVNEASTQMRAAWRDNAEAISDATANTKDNLDDIAAKHEETVGKIRASLVALKSEFDDAEEDRRLNFQETEEERRRRNQETEATRLTDSREGEDARRQAAADSLAKIEADHQDSTWRITRQASAARTAEARQAVQTARLEEQDTYQERLKALAKKTEADETAAKHREEKQATADAKAATEAETKAAKRFADEEARAKKSFDKKQLALEAALLEESKSYDKAVTKEEERYADQLKRLARQYEKEQELNRAHLAKLAEQEANPAAATGSSGSESPFEIEMRKMLSAAGLTADEVNAKMELIKAGTLSTADVLPILADGFKNQYDAAQKSGEKIDQAGEAMKLFGKQGYLMLGVLRDGGQAFKDDAFLAAEYGVAVGPEGEKKIADYMKAQADLNAELRGIKITIATELMPVMKEWMDSITKWVKEHREEIVGAFEKIGEVLGNLGDWVVEHREELIGFLKDFYNEIEPIGRWIHDHDEKVLGFFQVLAFTTALGYKPLKLLFEIWSTLFNFASDWYDEHGETVEGFFEVIFGFATDIKGAFEDAYDPMVDFFKMLLGFAKDAKEALDKLNPVEAVKSAVGNIPGAGIVKSVAGKGGDVIGKITGHADGLAEVPYDNYLAYLHQGERVLTKREADVLKSSQGHGSGQGMNFGGMHFYGPVTLGGASNKDDIPLIAWGFENELRGRGAGV